MFNRPNIDTEFKPVVSLESMPSAYATSPPVARGTHEVITGVRMPIGTVGLFPIVAPLPSMIFSLGDKIQMIRINTGSIPAEMIHHISIRDAIEFVIEDVGYSVCPGFYFMAKGGIIVFESTVSIRISAVPIPTRVCESFGDVAVTPVPVEPVLGGFPAGWIPEAFPTSSISILNYVGVFLSKFMALPTMSVFDRLTPAWAGVPATAISLECDHIKMFRVHADPVVAQMVDGEPLFDWAEEDLICDAVGVFVSSFEAESRASILDGADPIPTWSIDPPHVGDFSNHIFGLESSDVLLCDLDGELPQSAILSVYHSSLTTHCHPVNSPMSFPHANLMLARPTGEV